MSEDLHIDHSLVQHYNVLLLDDSVEDREICKRRLKRIPGIEFHITESQDFEQAREMTLGHNFDCFLIDYSLPGTNGLDFIRFLQEKRKDNIKASALIIVTGQGNEDLAAEAFKLGVHEYITKKALVDGELGRPIMNAIEKAQLMTQLESFRAQLERSHRDLSEFTHTAAHDLKSPLRRIISYCDILEEDAGARLNDEDKGILKRMKVNAKRMRELIDSLLTYSLVNTNDEEKTETDLKAMADDIVSEFQPHIEETGAQVNIDFLPKASVYPVRMRQLLCNLISNALKYKDEDRPLHIDIGSSIENDILIVSVKDNGVGIAPSQCDEVFEDFKRLYANEEIEGTGLGLSICKKIARRHGGDIWVESQPGEGSVFYFSIALEEM